MGMRFIINGLKYETDNMEEVAEVRKWYRVNDLITNLMYPGKKWAGYANALFGNQGKEIGF